MNRPDHKPITAAGIILGIGLGGFFDGILLHQILQWHQVLSSVHPPITMQAMELNTRWDGFFHAFVWMATVGGILLLWNGGHRPANLPGTRWFIGLLVMGWGFFNLVEGIINHHILGLHHVRYIGDIVGGAPNMAWDLGFVVIGGLGFILLGWALTSGDDTPRKGRSRAAPP